MKGVETALPNKLRKDFTKSEQEMTEERSLL
jgi:hypothetical protein